MDIYPGHRTGTPICTTCRDWMKHRAQDSSSVSLQRAAVAQQRDLAGDEHTRSEPGYPEAERLRNEVERLRNEVERLQRELESARTQLLEETRRVRHTEEKATAHKKTQEASKKQLQYQEYKSEYLRRELEKRGRPRSLNRDTRKYETLPDRELRGLVGNHELFRNVYNVQSDEDPEESMTKKERKRLRQKEREEEEREEKEFAAQQTAQEATRGQNPSLGDRLRDPTRTLAERIQFGTTSNPSSQDDIHMTSQDEYNPSAPEASDELPHIPLHDRIDRGPLIDRVEGGPTRPEQLPADQRERWFRRMEGWDPTRKPIARQRLYREYIPMFDNNHRRIYLNGQQQGFRIVYGYVINAMDPLPPRDPTREMINPITGVQWTEQELQEYPYGYPGYPEHWPEGRISKAERIGFAPGVGVAEGAVGPSRVTAPLPDGSSPVYRGQDHSRTRLRDLRTTAAGAEFLWQFPETIQEVQLLHEVAHDHCNLEAFEFWKRFVRHCNETPREQRTAAQLAATATSWPRPSWAPYRKPTTARKRPKKGKMVDRTSTPVPADISTNHSSSRANPVAPEAQTVGQPTYARVNDAEPNSNVTAIRPSSPVSTTRPAFVNAVAGPSTLPVVHDTSTNTMDPSNDQNWLAFLNAHQEHNIIGIRREVHMGHVENTEALQGALIVAGWGPRDADGLGTI
jgi:hypothetical protein